MIDAQPLSQDMEQAKWVFLLSGRVSHR